MTSASAAGPPGIRPPDAAVRFDAFLSHASADKQRVFRLHGKLEALPGVEGRPICVFYDVADMAARGIWTELDRALDESRTLVVCVSPALRGSRYVKEEVRRFRHRHPEREILVALIDGDENCIPDALSGVKYADLRSALSRRPAYRKNDELLRLGSAICRVPLRTLIPWAARRRLRVVATTAILVALPAVAGAIVALYQWAQLKTQQAERLVDQAHLSAETEDDPASALERLYEAESLHASGRHRHSTSFLLAALRPLDDVEEDDPFVNAFGTTHRIGPFAGKVSPFAAKVVFEASPGFTVAVSDRGEIATAGAGRGILKTHGLKAFVPSTIATLVPRLCPLPGRQDVFQLNVPNETLDDHVVLVDAVTGAIEPRTTDQATSAACFPMHLPRELAEFRQSLFVADDNKTAPRGDRPTAPETARARVTRAALEGILPAHWTRGATRQGTPAAGTELGTVVRGTDEVVSVACTSNRFAALLRPSDKQYIAIAIPNLSIVPDEANTGVPLGTELGSPTLIAPDCAHFVDLSTLDLYTATRSGPSIAVRRQSLSHSIRQAAFSNDSSFLAVTDRSATMRIYGNEGGQSTWRLTATVQIASMMPLPQPGTDAFGNVPFWDSFQNPLWLRRFGHLSPSDEGDVVYLDGVARLTFYSTGTRAGWHTSGPVVRPGQPVRDLAIAGDYVYAWSGSSVSVFSREDGMALETFAACECRSNESDGSCRLEASESVVKTVCEDDAATYRVPSIPPIAFDSVEVTRRNARRTFARDERLPASRPYRLEEDNRSSPSGNRSGRSTPPQTSP